MKVRLAKKIIKADTYADYPSKHPLPYWKAKFKEAYNENGCVMFCEGSRKCKYRNKFDHRIKKAISLVERWNARRYRNEAAKLNKKNPLRPRDLRRSVERLKQYSV